MKRFFNFLLFVLLLALAVASVQVWADRRHGAYSGWRRTVMRFLERDHEHRLPEKYTVAEGPRVDSRDVDILAALSRQRVALARAVVPSVVSVITSRTVDEPDAKADPFAFFHRGLRGGGGSAIQRQLGSGAIVSREGHIVTNVHVIRDMEEIVVELSDGRREAARLIGTDEDTDIAVLKIDAGDMVPLPFGDSDAVEVGETVMAVGNPYGLEESVTQGIISAKGRRGSENTSDLFQTDAWLNPGNSGGPLINVRGELIGINEAIFSDSGGWEGVGFAIPSDTVRRTMDGILKLGRVVHNYLGIWQGPPDPRAMAEHGAGNGKGVLVDRVSIGSPAEKAAILPGDVIQKFNHKVIGGIEDLRRGVDEVGIDAAVPVEVLRNGKTLSVTARVAEAPPTQERLAQAPHVPRERHPFGWDAGPTTSGKVPILGARLQNLTPTDLRKLDLPEGLKGVIVLEVSEGSPVAGKLQPGDVIEQVNQQPVGSLDDLIDQIAPLPRGHPLALLITRQGHQVPVTINRG